MSASPITYLRRISVVFVLSGLIGMSCRDESVPDARISEAQELTQSYQKALKAELVRALNQGGPARAIEVCNHEAPRIGERVAKTKPDWTIGRTAQRVRNSDNSPNDWQRRGLDALEKQLAQGTPPEQAQWHERRDDGFVYMKPIMTGGVCVTCHGEPASLSPGVKKKIAELYPGDEATGFAVGDLRGAFFVAGPIRN